MPSAWFFVLRTKAITDLVERNREDFERMRPTRTTRILRMRSLGFLIRDIGVIRGQMAWASREGAKTQRKKGRIKSSSFFVIGSSFGE